MRKQSIPGLLSPRGWPGVTRLTNGVIIGCMFYENCFRVESAFYQYTRAQMYVCTYVDFVILFVYMCTTCIALEGLSAYSVRVKIKIPLNVISLC